MRFQWTIFIKQLSTACSNLNRTNLFGNIKPRYRFQKTKKTFTRNLTSHKRAPHRKTENFDLNFNSKFVY